jgi:hypothetical protein
MKIVTTIVALALALIMSTDAFSATRVKGHSRKSGTHVQAHHRTAPNKTKRDNYSTKGNTNPHTGKRGTKKSR